MKTTREGSALLVVMGIVIVLGMLGFAFDQSARSAVRGARRSYLGQVALLGAHAAADQALADWLRRARPASDGGQMKDNLERAIFELKDRQIAHATHTVDPPTSPPDATIEVKSARTLTQFLQTQAGAGVDHAPELAPEEVESMRAAWRQMYLSGT